ncbi:FxsB family radical SAM/SPASM domain protein [Streptomyces albiaxialis]|uniref:FxsB family radical SAM/SPASM domain protein n=1 Tax=Streptomyces albiaxialis TaxID=329523 RepID=A0ABP5I777_9ACTN
MPGRPSRAEHPSPEQARPAGLEWIVLKIAQRCNLDCDYCYVYNRGDTSWLTRPTYISDRVTRRLAERIAAHCRDRGLTEFVVELHGGEPLLLGRRRMQRLIDTLRGICAPAHVRVMLQTNGLLLTGDWLDLFARNGMTFGLSLDGPPEIADRHRVLRGSHEGTTERLLDTVAALRAQGPLFDELLGGVLCVVDPAAHGGELVRWFADQGFPDIDFLLPDGNRVNPPQGWTGPEPYRRFLLEAFDAWYGGGPRAARVRLFELMMLSLLGRGNSLDALGGDLKGLCVVESDGSIGISDVLRICLGPYAHDSLNVFDHPLDAHAGHYRLDELQRPCATCLACPHFTSCQGGYLPHRFDGTSFSNPSLYCEALYALSARMTEALETDLPAAAWQPEAA